MNMQQQYYDAILTGFPSHQTIDSQWLDNCLQETYAGLHGGWLSICEARYFLRGLANGLMICRQTLLAEDIWWLIHNLDALEGMPS